MMRGGFEDQGQKREIMENNRNKKVLRLWRQGIVVLFRQRTYPCDKNNIS